MHLKILRSMQQAHLFSINSISAVFATPACFNVFLFNNVFHLLYDWQVCKNVYSFEAALIFYSSTTRWESALLLETLSIFMAQRNVYFSFLVLMVLLVLRWWSYCRNHKALFCRSWNIIAQLVRCTNATFCNRSVWFLFELAKWHTER